MERIDTYNSNVGIMHKVDFKILLYHEEWQLDGGFAKRATNNAVEV